MKAKLISAISIFLMLSPVVAQELDYKYKSVSLKIDGDLPIRDSDHNDEGTGNGGGNSNPDNDGDWDCDLDYVGALRLIDHYMFQVSIKDNGTAEYDLYIGNNYHVYIQELNNNDSINDFKVNDYSMDIDYDYILNRSPIEDGFEFHFHEYNEAYEYKANNEVMSFEGDHELVLRYSVCKREVEYSTNGFPS